MKKVLVLSLLFSIFGLTSSNAQAFKSWEYGIGYFANTFINPGAEFVVSTPLIDSKISGNKYSFFGDTAIKLQGSLALYWDPFSHTGLTNSYGLTFEQNLGKRLGFMVGGGVQVHSNITGSNYLVDENFELKKRWLKFNSYTGLYMSAGTFIDRKKYDHTYLLKGTFSLLANYNTIYLPVFSTHFTYFF